MKVQVHASALKREPDQDVIKAVWQSGESSWCWLDSSDVQRQLRIGLDSAGRDFELVGIVFTDDRVLITHYMRARPWAYKMLEEARRNNG